jgi:hypothetical protein
MTKPKELIRLPSAFKHGALSKLTQARYKDHRYREAKQLRAIMTALAEDFGGQGNLTEAQKLLMGNIRSKLIVLFQIGKYIEARESIINEEGELIPCLGRHYTAFAEALRRDLLALAQLGGKPKPPNLDQYINATYGKK